MGSIKEYLKEKQGRVNSALEDILKNKEGGGADQLVAAMIYSALGGGKRIRPILCIGAAEALGAKLDGDLLKTACALEILHTYSLIHDDLPAMDDDDLRRGQPTCHVQFDEATAILAGDALLTLTFDILSQIGFHNPDLARKCLHMIQVISTAAGHKGMVQGQYLDIINEGQSISMEQLKTIHGLKTGALIRASVISGAIWGDADEKQIKKLTAYADAVGLAFQVMDDVLNVEGDPDELGKAVGTDLQRKKCTYPALMGLGPAKDFAASLVNHAINAIQCFDHKADPLREIAIYVINRNK